MLRQSHQQHKTPRSDAEDRRIVYYLNNSDELTMEEIASRFNRDLKYIKCLAQKNGIRRRKRGVI